ncbi:MAG: glycosyltransferase [Spirochaetaceae bacterium]|nr:MAG: glycosyltransferase [Spirochaetaceae bacterium]
MKIAWLSSWPPRHCGIATYSAELVEVLRREGHEIHIVCHPDGGAPNEKDLYPVIDTDHHGWDEAVYETVKSIDPEVVHIQHEFGLYNTSADNASGLFRPMFRWKAEEKPAVVVTYHSVYTELNFMIRSYMDVMQQLADAGIVHAEYQWAYLHTNLGRIVDNVYVIPHGASAGTTVSKDDAKQALGLKGKKVLGMIGWFTFTKGFHRILSMWDRLSEQLGPDTVLVLAGDARQGDPNQIGYKKELLDLVESSKAKNSIKVVLGSFTPREYERILASFDAMVMPYSFASQSGNLAHSFSLGVPVVVSGLEGLKAEVEASGAGITFQPDDDTELKRAIMNIMGDDGLRREYSERAKRYVDSQIGWNIIASKHEKLYRKVIMEKKAEPPDLRDRALLGPEQR